MGTGAGTSADLIGTGFLPSNFSPTAVFGTVSMTAGGAIQIVGTGPAGNCTVTLAPLGVGNAVNWDFANTAGGCNRTRTGVGT